MTKAGGCREISIPPQPLPSEKNLFAAGYAQACLEHAELRGGEYYINGMTLTDALDRGPVLPEEKYAS